MSFTLGRDQFGRPITKPVSIFNNPSLLNQLADTKPAGTSKVTYESLTIGDVVVDNSLVSKLATTTNIVEGVAEAGKALVLDYNRNVSGINKIYVDSLYINGVLLNPNIFKGSAVAVSTADSQRQELLNVTPGIAKENKALILNDVGKISNINKVKTDALEVGNRVVVNRSGNNLSMNNVEYLNRFYNKHINLYFDKMFKEAVNIGAMAGDSYGSDHYILNNCYSSSLEIHVGAFSDGSLGYSYDGVCWIRSAITSNVSFVIWANALNLFVAVGSTNLYTSANGISWTAKKISNVDLYSVEYAEDRNLFVIGGNRRILFSNDLNGDWTVSDYTQDPVRQIVYINSSRRFIASVDTGACSILCSTDGKRWIAQPVHNSNYSIRWICYAKSKNIIVLTSGPGNNGRAYRNGYYSKDGGFTFKPYYSQPNQYGMFNRIIFVPDYNIFIGVPAIDERRTDIAYSVDGVNWRGVVINGDASSIYSAIHNKKTNDIFLRTKKHFTGGWHQYRVASCAFGHGFKSYKLGESLEQININSTDNKMLNIGNDNGNLINVLYSGAKTVRLSNGELEINSSSVNITNKLFAVNNGSLFSMNNFSYINSFLATPYYMLNYYNSDKRNLKNYYTKIEAGKVLNIHGYLKVDSLNVNNISFDKSNNNEEFKNVTIGNATANKFLIAKFGGEVNGVNRIKNKSVRVGNYKLSNNSLSSTAVVDLDKKHNIFLKGMENRMNPFGSQLYNSANDIVVSTAYVASTSTSDVFNYIKETGTFVLRKNTNMLLNDLGTEITLAAGTNQFEFIKELNSYYLATSNGLLTSKDMISWKMCNLYEDINKVVNGFAYSPLLNNLIAITDTKNQVSKNGIDFRNIHEMRNMDRLNCILWVDSWAMFLGITNSSNGARKQYMYSVDGCTWNAEENQEETLIKSSTMPNEIIYSPKLDMALAATTSSQIVRYTYDGKLWNTYNVQNGRFYGRITWIEELDVFIGASNYSLDVLLFYSYDGIEWIGLKNPSSLSSYSYFTNKWVYSNRLGSLINTNTSGTPCMVFLKPSFLKNSNISHTYAINEEDSIISVDFRNNRVGLGVEEPQFSLQLGEDLAFKPTTTTWATSSDERLKEEIQTADLDKCLDNVKNIPLKKYKWKESVYPNSEVNHKKQLGWLAQDVESIIPKAVERKNMHGYEDCRTLNNDQIIANMYGAIKKLMKLDKELDEYFE